MQETFQASFIKSDPVVSRRCHFKQLLMKADDNEQPPILKAHTSTMCSGELKSLCHFLLTTCEKEMHECFTEKIIDVMLVLPRANYNTWYNSYTVSLKEVIYYKGKMTVFNFASKSRIIIIQFLIIYSFLFFYINVKKYLTHRNLLWGNVYLQLNTPGSNL